MMTCALGPGTEKVVGHEVEEVEELGALGEWNVLQVPFCCWKSRCENVGMLWKELPDGLEKEEIVVAFGRVRRMLPVNVESIKTVLNDHGMSSSGKVSALVGIGGNRGKVLRGSTTTNRYDGL